MRDILCIVKHFRWGSIRLSQFHCRMSRIFLMEFCKRPTVLFDISVCDVGSTHVDVCGLLHYFKLRLHLTQISYFIFNVQQFIRVLTSSHADVVILLVDKLFQLTNLTVKSLSPYLVVGLHLLHRKVLFNVLFDSSFVELDHDIVDGHKLWFINLQNSLAAGTKVLKSHNPLIQLLKMEHLTCVT